MNKYKDLNMAESIARFSKEGLTWKSSNKGLHWFLADVNFYPTTHRWQNIKTGKCGMGIESALKEIKRSDIQPANYKSVEDLVKIARKVKVQNLFSICEAIHKEIYK